MRSMFLLSCSALAVCLGGVDARAQQLPQAGAPPEQATSVPPADPATVPADGDTVEAASGDEAPAKRDVSVAAHLATIAKLREERAARKSKRSPDDTIVVTGSRLRDGDVTTRLTVIDAQDIQARGVTSVEQLIRTLPQNVATIGAITNDRGRGPLINSEGRSVVSAVGSLGVSAANLGGLGAGNTLVLVNGRRIAGAAGIEAGFVNLNGIPIAAIERVEISSGGSSAIYGADALGGVVNFILKKNYVGTTISAQHETTSSGEKSTRISLYSGYAWNTGNLSGTLDFSRRSPIVNARTGYVTNNYAPYFGGLADYDKRNFSSGTQPGVIDRPAVYDPDTGEVVVPETGLTVPKGFTGAPRKSDLIEVGLDNARDYVPQYAGPRTRSFSASLAGEQSIAAGLNLFFNALYTRSKNMQENNYLQGLQIPLAPGQYYNPFPAYGISGNQPETIVNYFPDAEIAGGTLQPGQISNVATSWSVNVGARYDVTKDIRAELVYTQSSSKTTGTGTQLGSIVNTFIEDAGSPTGFSCYNFSLANDLLPAAQRAAFKAAFDRQCQILTSTDPNIAFDPWKSTTNGGGSSVNTFLFTPLQDDLKSTLRSVEGRLTGTALKLPGGKLTFAIGGEYTENGVDNRYIQALTGGNGDSSRYAFFGEMNLPVFGGGFTLPAIRRLIFNVAARRDVTTTTGAVGTVDGVPLDQGGKIIFAQNRFARTTPAIGLLWSPVFSIDIRARFTRGFKAPPATQLFNIFGSYAGTTTIYDDPLYRCTTDCAPRTDGRGYEVPTVAAPNPDLKPETSRQQVYSATWRPDGALAGLNLSIGYNRNQIRNQFARLLDLYKYAPAATVLTLSQFYPRDASGKITSERDMRLNIIGSTVSFMTYEASYLAQTRFGTFEPKVTYLRYLTSRVTGIDESFSVSSLGTILGVDRYKIVGSLRWSIGPVTTNLFVYHTPSYLNDYAAYYYAGALDRPDLVTRVAPLTTADLTASWVVNKTLSVQFAGRNILKTSAPFAVVGSLPYDTARYNVEGRTLLISAQLSF